MKKASGIGLRKAPSR